MQKADDSFVAQACLELSEAWRRFGDGNEEQFLWIYMLKKNGHTVLANLTDLVKVAMEPEDGAAVDRKTFLTTMEDSVNILTYEHGITDAVLCHCMNLHCNSVENDFGDRMTLSYGYDGSFGQFTNFRGFLVTDGKVLFEKPILGTFERPMDNVERWFPFGRNLVPCQGLRTRVVQNENLWWVTVNEMMPKMVVPDVANGFKTQFEAQEARMQAMMQLASHVPEINQEVYNFRRARCPIKFEIDKIEPLL